MIRKGIIESSKRNKRTANWNIAKRNLSSFIDGCCLHTISSWWWLKVLVILSSTEINTLSTPAFFICETLRTNGITICRMLSCVSFYEWEIIQRLFIRVSEEIIHDLMKTEKKKSCVINNNGKSLIAQKLLALSRQKRFPFNIGEVKDKRTNIKHSIKPFRCLSHPTPRWAIMFRHKISLQLCRKGMKAILAGFSFRLWKSLQKLEFCLTKKFVLVPKLCLFCCNELKSF